MKTAISLLGCTAILACAAPAIAQDNGDKQPIIVTGRGLDATPSTIAYSTVVLDQDQLESAASGRIEDVLSNVAGFQQFRRSDSRSANPTAQGVTLRALGGNASSRALVLLDGVPMVDPFFGHVPLAALPADQLSTIRVTRGGGSGPFGAGALAGTIELETADAQELGVLRGMALANDRGDTEWGTTIAPDWDGGYGVLYGRWDRGNGFWTTPEADRVPASAKASYDTWSVGARLVQALTPDIEVQLRGLAWQDDRTLRFVGADNWTEGEDVSLRVVGRGEWQFDIIGYGQWRNFSNIVISSSTYNPVLDQRDTPATGFGGKLEVRPPVGGGHTLRLGADFRQSDGDLSEFRFNAGTGAANGSRFAGGTNSDVGFFVEDDYTIGPVLLTGGVRADHWSQRNGYHLNLNAGGGKIEDSIYPDRSGWDVTWRAGASFDVARGVRLRAAAYTGLRQPTLNELYRPFVVFPVTTNANADLTNEHLFGYEAGIDVILPEGAEFSLTAFDNRLEDAIANVTLYPDLCDANPNVPGNCDRERQNLDAVNAQGIEFTTRIGMGPVSFFGSLTYTDSTVEGSGVQARLNGFRPSQTPDFAASASLSYEPKNGMRFAATLRHVSDQFEGDMEDDVLPAATTLDLFASVRVWRELDIVLRGENVFDETIVTRNQKGSMDLGVPATFWGGLRWGF